MHSGQRKYSIQFNKFICQVHLGVYTKLFGKFDIANTFLKNLFAPTAIQLASPISFANSVFRLNLISCKSGKIFRFENFDSPDDCDQWPSYDEKG